MNPVFLLLAALAADPATPATSGVSDADLLETDCRTMSRDQDGNVVTILLPSLHVLTQAAAEGPFRPALPRGVSALFCRRNSIVPAEHDDEVPALGLPLYLSETKAGGRVGVLEIEGGQFRYRMVKGILLAGEARLVEARMSLFQKRPRRRR